MANYKHGVYVSETDTSLIPTVRVESAIPFVVGTAPINQIDNPEINKPVLINSYAEAVAAFGFEDAKENAAGVKTFAYTLSEFIKAHFTLYATVPVLLVNVLDPAKHRKTLTTTSVDLTSGTATINETGALPATVQLSHVIPGVDGASDQVTAYTQDEDYSVAFNDAGQLVINALKDTNGAYKVTGQLTISGYKLDPTAVTKADIIGGVTVASDGTTHNYGLESVADVYPRFRLIPTLILAPGFSSDPEVAVVMAAKASKINGHFEAMALIDAPATGAVKKYSDVVEWKGQNGLSAVNTMVCWPCVQVGETVYHASVHAAGVTALTDEDNDSVPYVSPSNKAAGITGMCLEDGTEVVYGVEQANYLNGQGVVTFNNFTGGWKLWGNRTAGYPGTTDPKDAFIPVKRMFQWIGNTLVTTMWQRVDDPGNRRLIDSVVDSFNVTLNSLTARGQLLGGRVEFRSDDNPETQLMDGIYKFKVWLTPPSPGEDLEFDLEIDTAYYSTLFE